MPASLTFIVSTMGRRCEDIATLGRIDRVIRLISATPITWPTMTGDDDSESNRGDGAQKGAVSGSDGTQADPNSSVGKDNPP
ncbi:hypothetical protein GCM10027068_20760 [Prescottella soli]